MKNFGSVEGGSPVNKHDHFAAHVDALIIVPLVLGRDDAVPDEYRGRIELRIGALLIGDADELVEPL